MYMEKKSDVIKLFGYVYIGQVDVEKIKIIYKDVAPPKDFSRVTPIMKLN